MKRSPILLLAGATVLTAVSQLSAQDPFGGPAPDADPFIEQLDKLPDPEAAPADISGGLSVCYETFSVDLATAASISRTDRPDAAVYELLVALATSGRASQDHLTLLRVRSGQKGKSESIAEYTYPTEWEPAELPNSVGVQIEPAKAKDGTGNTAPPDVEKLKDAPRPEELPTIATPATATAFETRNLGFTLEVEPILGADKKTIEFRIAPEHVQLAGVSVWGKGVSQLEMPEIESQRVVTGITAQEGIPRLLGTMNRSPHSKIDENAVNRVSFAFVTINHVRR